MDHGCLRSHPVRTKYRAQKTEVDGIIFDSKKEAKRYRELLLLFRGGYIRNLEIQVPFEFKLEGKPMFKYIADFIYFEGLQRVVEDCKGFRTPLYRLKKKLIEHQFKLKIRET